jgi:hypothetical protein
MTAVQVTAYDPAVPPHRDDPFPELATARGRAPVVWCPAEGVWMVTRYDECAEVLNDPGRFSSVDLFRQPRGLCEQAQATLERGYEFEQIRPVTAIDPPHHTHLRRIMAAAFKPRRVAALEQPIRARAHALIDRFAGDGQIDLVAHYASPLTVFTIVELLGLPLADASLIRRWSDDRIALYWGELTAEQQIACATSLLELEAYLQRAVEERQRRPTNDYISDLITAAPDDVPLAKIIGQLMVLVSAGHETTTSAISTGVLLLLAHREQWDALCADPHLAARAIEEVLRMDGPSKGFLRTAHDDCELGGVQIRAGDRLRVMMTSANHDETAFANPDRFDVIRPPGRGHLTFGHGIHYCLGAALARLESQVALRALSNRLPTMRIAAGHRLHYRPNNNLRILTGLPVKW